MGESENTSLSLTQISRFRIPAANQTSPVSTDGRAVPGRHAAGTHQSQTLEKSCPSEAWKVSSVVCTRMSPLQKKRTNIMSVLKKDAAFLHSLALGATPERLICEIISRIL